MCGLVGMYGKKLEFNESKVLQILLHVDTIRGHHSTGVAAIKNSGESNLYKEVGSPFSLYEKFSKEFPSGRMSMYEVTAVLGHNRYATQGAHTVENAHPFDMGDIIGMHNGTVNQNSLKSLNGYKTIFMDTKIIFNHLNDTKKIEDIWEVADGAMALVWWDKTDKTLHFARNKERPLFYTLSEDKKKMFWASEEWMLWVALARNGVKYDEIVNVDVDKHYTFTTKEDETIDIVTENLKPYVKLPVVYKDPYVGYKVNTTYKSNSNSKEVAHEADFFLTDFHIVQRGRGGKILTGWFSGYSTLYETIRVVVNKYTPQIDEIVKRIKSDEDWCMWTTKNAQWTWSKKQQEMVLVVEWADVKLDYDPSKTDKSYLDEQKAKKANAVVKSKSLSRPEEIAYNIYGKVIDKEEYMSLTIDGCEYCKGEVSWEDRETIEWIGYRVCLCAKCADVEAEKRAERKVQRDKEALQKASTNVIPFEPKVINDHKGFDVKGPYLARFNETFFINLCTKGCASCLNPIDTDTDPALLTWKWGHGAVESLICPTCSETYN